MYMHLFNYFSIHCSDTSLYSGIQNKPLQIVQKVLSTSKVTVIYIAIINRHDFIATYSYGCYLDDQSTKILVYGRIGILTGYFDFKSEVYTPWDINIGITQTWKSYKQS